MTDTMTTQEAAEFLGVHPVTLRKWRMKSGIYHGRNVLIFEDCQGLHWSFEHPKKVIYYTSSVQHLKRILQRRKGK